MNAPVKQPPDAPNVFATLAANLLEERHLAPGQRGRSRPGVQDVMEDNLRGEGHLAPGLRRQIDHLIMRDPIVIPAVPSEDAAPAPGVALNASFLVTQVSSTEVEVTTGSVYIAGVSQTITNFPVAAITVTTNKCGYIKITYGTSSVTVEWVVAASEPGDGSDTIEYWPIFVATIADGAITAVKQRWLGDIHITQFS